MPANDAHRHRADRKCARAAALLLALGALGAHGAPEAAAHARSPMHLGRERMRPTESVEPVAITISGGVSMGAYEAGLTWGLVQTLRASEREGGARLTAVTGASAGSINALLAAALWCEDSTEQGDQDPDHNLFRDTWLTTDVDALLPDQAQSYRSGDGLMVAAPLEQELERLRQQIFLGGRKLRPGCRVPLGVTVTRTDPQERDVGGLRGRTQRFVVPLTFEVTSDRRARLLRAPLPAERAGASASLFLGERLDPETTVSEVPPEQLSLAILASGAFPLAFQPRELCDCALACPAERLAGPTSCPGPQGLPLGQLICAAVEPVGKRKLCKQSYVDGGIFDTLPVGLAIDLAEASIEPSPLHPITYLVVDPDFRRHLPPDPSMGSKAAELGVKGPLQLLSNLITTARTSELTNAVRADSWNRTTRSTLAEAAALFGSFVELQDRLVQQAGAGEAQALQRMPLLRHPDRERIGRLLHRCLFELQARGFNDSVRVSRCAAELREAPGAGEAEAQRLSPSEVLSVARWLSVLLGGTDEQSRPGLTALTNPRASLAMRLRGLGGFRDGALIATLAFRYLDGEIDGVAHSGLPEAALREFRRDLLATVKVAGRLAMATGAMLRVLGAAIALEESGQLEHAAEKLLASELEEPVEPLLERLADSLQPRPARLDELLDSAARLRTMGARVEELTRKAVAVEQGEATERQLVVLRRFAPISAAYLFNFAAFLDRSLLEHDFLVGVYDTVVGRARYACQTQGPYASGRPSPVFRADDPQELDLSSPETWRCMGPALQASAQALHIDASPRARTMLSRLIRLEMVAALDDAEAAGRLMSEPSWSWVGGEEELPADDPVLVVLESLTARRRACSATSRWLNCLADPSFEELLAELRLRGFRPSSRSMAEALRDAGLWQSGMVRKLADRSASIELQNASRDHVSPSDTLLLSVGAGELWSRRSRSQGDAPRFEADPSTVPWEPLPGARDYGPLLAHLVPYRLGLDVARGGIAFSWLEPALRVRPWLALETMADLVDVDGQSRFSSTLGLLPTVSLGGFALSAGARWSLRWKDGSNSPGWVSRLSILQERLAVTAGVRALGTSERTWFISLSVSDLNGLAYWLAPWSGR